MITSGGCTHNQPYRRSSNFQSGSFQSIREENSEDPANSVKCLQ